MGIPGEARGRKRQERRAVSRLPACVLHPRVWIERGGPIATEVNDGDSTVRIAATGRMWKVWKGRGEYDGVEGQSLG